jgi:hypothetical protein
MNDEFKLETTCAFCGKIFEPHPDSYWETGVEVMEATEENEQWMETHAIDPSDRIGMNEAQIDGEAMKQLVKAKPGDFIETGAVAVCDDCSKKSAEELGQSL